VSITEPGLLELPAGVGRFPAVLDIGFNDNFFDSGEAPEELAGLTVDALYPTG